MMVAHLFRMLYTTSLSFLSFRKAFFLSDSTEEFKILTGLAQDQRIQCSKRQVGFKLHSGFDRGI